ncbi:MAG TPA: glycosyltransferase family 4 protein [Pyrinomonadaceae bacterium]|jgi:glycosyltransferase involved in cell wall biosynthesis
MKIAVWYNLPSGGAKRALYYHVRGLVERGHTVEAWCPPIKGHTSLPLGSFIKEHVVPLDWQPTRLHEFVKRTPILEAEILSEDLSKLRAQDKHCRLCADEINAGGFDVLFANTSVIQAVASIGRYVETAKVLYLQEPSRGFYEAGPNGLPWLAVPPRARAWMRPRYLAWLVVNAFGVQQFRTLAREEYLSARVFDEILVNSYFSRESVLRAYGLDAKVCYLGVDTKLFVNRHLERENFVVGLGEINRHKNVRFVIEALGRVPPPTRPRLVWVGNAIYSNYLTEMQQLAASLNVEFETRMQINDDELVELLNRAALMAYAPRLEPFGFAPLEANACGTPVVAVAEGGVRETVSDDFNGLLVAPEPQAMADAIERLMRDKNVAQRLGANGERMVAEKWSLGASVDRLERHLVETVVAKNPVQNREISHRDTGSQRVKVKG